MSTQPGSVDPHDDVLWMRRAIGLARRGEGLVEPNPMVGCVIVRGSEVLGEGWHRYFGGPHAERDALAAAGDGANLSGATWYVTLEPCCHKGKTPPCTGAIIASRAARVVAALRDPFPLVNGRGFEEITRAGIAVTVGVEEGGARQLCAPFLKRIATGRPWVIAKWAMTLDGKIATSAGDSRWISCSESRRRVHSLRGRVDGIMIGVGTAIADDPRLTARPEGTRTAIRLIVDRHGALPLDSQLVRTARETPVRIFVGPLAPEDHLQQLREAGVDVVHCTSNHRTEMLGEILDHCGREKMTNLLVEGGGGLLGALNDGNLIDEAHVFIAPKIVGGLNAVTPMAGTGLGMMREAERWKTMQVECIENDVLIIVRKHQDGANREERGVPKIL